MKKLYMHTIDGKPADFYTRDGQICFKSHYRAAQLYSMADIQKHRRITKKNRTKWGMGYVDDTRYSCIRVKS